jgi:SOS-response transcriptional repressor LexA
MNHRSEPCLAQQLPSFTPRQGQYLAFIHAYTLVLGRPPGRTDIQRFFRITPPSAHQMLLTLERDGLIRRQKGVARSIQLLVNPSDLPQLQPVKISVQSDQYMRPACSRCPPRWSRTACW